MQSQWFPSTGRTEGSRTISAWFREAISTLFAAGRGRRLRPHRVSPPERGVDERGEIGRRWCGIRYFRTRIYTFPKADYGLARYGRLEGGPTAHEKNRRGGCTKLNIALCHPTNKQESRDLVQLKHTAMNPTRPHGCDAY